MSERLMSQDRRIKAGASASERRIGSRRWWPFSRREASGLPAVTGTRIRSNLHTLSWLGVCSAMGYAGAAQSNGAAYLLAFMAGSLGVMSYVYARANLRGLEVRVGASPVHRPGQGEVLPVELRAASGHAPWGIEVLLVGAAKAVFVEQIPSGQSVRLNLRLPSEGGSLRLLLRSAYPLGLLYAQRVVNVELTRHTVPPASGELPLPKVQTDPSGSAGQSSLHVKLSREGDDFAGVREWQPGDSPRHIDWRAVARGRPLMVKTWASGSSAAVHLDWDTLPLPEAERAGQIVRWIQMSEQQGLSYSLSLPGLEIAAGQGEAHARRCLQALAEIHAGGLAASENDRRLRIPASHEYTAEVPRGPLALLSVVLFLTALPLQDLVPWPILALLFFSLCYRNLVSHTARWRLLPLSVAAIGMGVVYFTQGTLISMEAGIAVLITLTGGKLLESKTPYDFQVIAMIGWFLCLCGLLTDQSITRSVWMFSSFSLITGCMVRFRRGVPGFKKPMRQTAWLMLQALPLVLLLFVVFPRSSLDYLERMGGGRTAVTGVTSSLDPGKVLQVARSTATAFRVEFPDGNIPTNDARYWRCVVLWECNGLSWRQGIQTGRAPELSDSLPQDIHQIITLEPHGQVWLPALDSPISYAKRQRISGLSDDRLLWSYDTVRKVRRVDVTSRSKLAGENLSAEYRKVALQLPSSLPESLQKVADRWRKTSANDMEVVQTGLNYLRSQGFEYTLEPGSYLGPNALEEFVLRRKIGFCEHFSAAFATLMRAAGVPSRVVMGYLGGEMSITGTHLIVRQSDAHSWNEVWLEGSGWTRIDPTAALAPERVNLDLQSYLLGDEEALERQRNSLLWRSMQQARLFLDQLNYQWYKMVISFDEDTQFGWLAWLGFGAMKEMYLLLISAFLVLLALVILTFWLRRPARDADLWRRAWGQMCARLESLGQPVRRENEGPLAYAERIRTGCPEAVELARQYAGARYGVSEISLRAFKKAVRDLR